VGDRRQCGAGMQLEGDHCVGAAKPPQTAKLLTANALMLTRRGNDLISAEYAALLKEGYAAELFKGARLDDVNSWVDRKTEGKIPAILDRLDDTATAVLLNAVYFKARWETPFDRKSTRDDAFNLSRSQKVHVPMMSRTGDFAVAARNGYRAVRLPYEIPTLGLVVVLPNEADGLREVAGRLDIGELAALFDALHGPTNPVALAIPRFRAEFKADLVAPFQQAGMKLPFDADRADFSGMTDRPMSEAGLFIGQIAHRAVIEVAEESTEAAAATAVVMAIRSAKARQPDPEIFRVDRPFLFYLVDDATGAILFQGRIVDPR
jgi:serpin B